MPRMRWCPLPTTLMLLILSVASIAPAALGQSCGDPVDEQYQCPVNDGTLCFIEYRTCMYGFSKNCQAYQLLYCTCNSHYGVIDFLPGPDCTDSPASASNDLRYSRFFVPTRGGSWVSITIAFSSLAFTRTAGGCPAAHAAIRSAAGGRR